MNAGLWSKVWTRSIGYSRYGRMVTARRLGTSRPIPPGYGFAYDSSMMAADFELYRCRTGDVIHTDRAVEFGAELDLVEVPVSWTLDDFRLS
jgi:hypothetical protein